MWEIGVSSIWNSESENNFEHLCFPGFGATNLEWSNITYNYQNFLCSFFASFVKVRNLYDEEIFLSFSPMSLSRGYFKFLLHGMSDLPLPRANRWIPLFIFEYYLLIPKGWAVEGWMWVESGGRSESHVL